MTRQSYVALVLLLLSAGSITGCGGGGGDGGGGGGLPVNMTLTATVVDPRSVDVRWTALAAPPTSYDLYVNGSFLFSTYGSNVHVAVTGLKESTHYCFVVHARDFPFGDASRSNESCVTTPADHAPSAATGLSAAVVSPVRSDLAWTAATDDWSLAPCRIERDGVLVGTSGGVTYSDVSANPSTQYCYRIVAVDTGGNLSPPTASVCATTTADTQSPTAPTGLSAVATGEAITLVWNPSSDDYAVAAYRIYRDGALVQTVPAPTTFGAVQAIDANLGTYTQYCYEVVAADRANNTSSASNRACTTTSWQRSVIRAGSTPNDYAGLRHALVVDAAGKLHIAYSYYSWDPVTRSYGPSELRYINNTGGTWADQPIVATYAGDHLAIVLDSSAHPQVGFRDSINGFPQYAQSSSGWQVETIALESSVGVALALDSSATPRVAYGRSAALRYGSRVNDAWSIANVPGVSSGREPALALDVSGRSHLAFTDSASHSLVYVSDAGGAWNTVTLESNATSIFGSVALAVDAAGAVHISYQDYDSSGGDLKYATNKTGSWVSAVIDGAAGGNVGLESSIAVDASGVVHISYLDAASSRLKYANNVGGTWRTYEIDYASVGASGWGDTSIAVDAGGRIHIVYFWGNSLFDATRP